LFHSGWVLDPAASGSIASNESAVATPAYKLIEGAGGPTAGLFIIGELRDNQFYGNINPGGQNIWDTHRNKLQLDFCVPAVRNSGVPTICR
jgi:hypothetical protein